MDARNLFETPATYRLIRLEYLVALLACLALVVANRGDVHVGRFVALFLAIDVVGYLPGALAYRRSPTGRIHRAYYVAYNTAHSLVTGAVVAGVWALVAGPEWALLAIPIHLCGDRALFGGFLKPFAVSFEPQTHPAYAALRERLAADDGEAPHAAAHDSPADAFERARP